MIYYLLGPFLAIMLIVLQSTAADILFSGGIVLEISLIAVIYAGFRLDLIRGAVSSLVLGFMFDCISGSVLGLFTFIYVLVFLFSFFVSTRMDTERMFLIALFALFCAFLEEFIVVLFYNLAYGFEMLHNTPAVFLLQALIVALLAPVFFHMMRKVEVFFYGKPAQSAQ